MTDIRRFLIVEDAPGWISTLELALHALVPDAQVEHAGSFDAAVRKVAGGAYDLVITDLLLPRSSDADDMPEELGHELARQVRADSRNRHAGLLVVTGYATPARTRDAFRGSAADDFIDKLSYTSREFLAAVRGALRASAIRRARHDAAGAVRLEIQVGATEMTGARIVGLSHASYPSRQPLPLPAGDWAVRADALNGVLLSSEPDQWRDAARTLGQELFEHMVSAPEISAGLASARSTVLSPVDLCVQFRGPAAAIGIPFELMRDGNGEYLVFRHQMVRSVTPGSGTISRKTSRFYDLVERAAESPYPIHALVVGANADGTVPGTEEEAGQIRLQLETELDRLGVACEVTTLIGPDATVANVSGVLSARHTHLFHYAGHGRFDGTLPEAGGLVLGSGAGPVSLRASDLYLLCKDSPLHLVFLSCCLSARSAVSPHQGDFDGVFDALAKADVPTVLGYRWVVGDESALSLATAFYNGLFRTLSPSSALFQARSELARRELGWNDETWLSPILIEQNP